MRKGLVLGIAAAVVGVTGGAAVAYNAISYAAPGGDLRLVCPHVPNPVAGQQITCTYEGGGGAPTTTHPPAPTTTTTTTSTSTAPTTTTGSTAPGAPTTPKPPTAGMKGWELTADNIGLKPHGLSCDKLPAYTGPAKPARGAVLSKVRINVPLDLSNGDITVEKSCIRPEKVGYHNSFLITTTICEATCKATDVGNVIVRDSEVDGSAMSATTIKGSCAFLGVGTVQRNYMHDMGSGICFFETGTKHSALAEQNYVRGLRAADESHNDGATVRDFRDAPGRTAKFINNRIDCSTGRDTGALFIQPTWVAIHNVFVEGNYLEGGGYNLYLEQTAKASYGNVHATNNRFRPTGWGPSTTSSGPGWVTFTDNYRYDSTKPDGKGAPVKP
jgi:hypothetical protein